MNSTNHSINMNQHHHLNHSNPNENMQPITLSSLLTTLDGNVEHNGLMVIMTTNYKEKIDKALIRPGRMDILLCLSNATPETINEMIIHFYNKKNITKSLIISNEQFEIINKYSRHQDKLLWSPAKITQICLSYINCSHKKYIQSILNYLKNNYDEEILLLD